MDLAKTAQIVSREKNYSVRAGTSGNRDEVATLIESFNEMLGQIQQRDGALQEARNELENRVKQRTAELVQAQEALRELSGRLLQTQDSERRRIARELHDSSGQILAALAMNLSILQNEAGKWDPRAQTIANDSVDLVQSVLQEVRTLSYLLHPPLLDDAGLDSALEWFVRGYSERSKIPVDLQLSPKLGRLPAEVETTIFRIVQECLTNIHRHSGSRDARICIDRDDSQVTVEVGDTGKGMPAEIVQSGSGRRGVGIQGMQERVRLLGGQFEIRSRGRGTTIHASIPLHESASPLLV